ncbi:MAG: sulfatase-like hydrolase/transferase [Chloroflexota bacterium]
MSRFKSLLWYPFAFCVFPILVLLGNNIEETKMASSMRSILVSLLGTMLLVLILRYVFKDKHKATVLTTFALLLFFSYGHIYNLVEKTVFLGMNIGRHRFLALLWLVMFISGLLWINRKKVDFSEFAPALNVISIVLLIFPIYQIASFQIRTITFQQSPQINAGQPFTIQLPQGKAAPDIYYIILDAYGRDDVLRKAYEFDNTPFIERLEQMGFYVARCSQSNYAQTLLSLASSLNLNYIEELDERFTSGNNSRVGLSDYLKYSFVRKTLERLGYETMAFESGYEGTQFYDSDYYFSPHLVSNVNDFESLLIRTTAARLITDSPALAQLQPDRKEKNKIPRERVLYTFDQLNHLPETSGPKFVFVHIISPHWPYIFGPNGEEITEDQDPVTGYRNQVIFLNREMETLLSTILNTSANPPIIIIQGDHGPVIESPQRRMSILNAYYLPDGGSQLLYENISPVNTFRIIFNYYFGSDYEILEDVGYYSEYEKPYDYTITPNKRSGCNQ